MERARGGEAVVENVANRDTGEPGTLSGEQRRAEEQVEG